MAGTVQIDQRDNVLVATLLNPPHGLMDAAMVRAIAALAALDALERSGELPAYDFDQQAAVDERGYFS